MNIIQDLYSPSIDLIYTQKQIQAISQRQIVKDIYPIREKQFITEIGNHKIYDVEIKPNIINKTLLQGRIMYEGQVELNFLFDSDNSARINTKNIVLPFNYNMDCEGANPASNIETNIQVNTQDFTVVPDGGIDIKIDLEFVVNLSNNQPMQVIEEINVDEKRKNDRSSLTIYFVKPGDTLWNIAKRFRSTVNDIAKINDIEDENKIDVGQQLFIPNYCLV